MSTSINWPGTLPQVVLQQGYKETFVNTAIRTQMDVGPAKVRQRTTAGAKPYTINLFLTSAQVDILETFFRTTTASGTLTFNMPDPRTAVSREFRFVNEPVINSDQANFKAAFDIEVLP